MPVQKKYTYRTRRRGTLARLFFVVAVCGLVAGGVGVFALITVTRNLPDPLLLGQRKVPESTKIYDRAGKVLLYEIHGEEKRTVVPFQNINQFVKDATIVVEDFDFYTHEGIDIRSIARAVFVDLSEGRLSQGGSTITQQLVKKAFLTPEKSWTRKIREAALAITIERNYSKEEIFGLYLNQIPFGSNIYGIEAAAQGFFNTSAADLTLNQAAVLAAIIRAPSYYSPYGSHNDELIARKNTVLNKMAGVGFISAEAAAQAQSEPLVFAPHKETILAPHFVFLVKSYLEDRYGVDMVENGGLRVYTTLDYTMQEQAERVIERVGAENEKKYRARNAALAAVDPATGQLLVMVGSRDYFDRAREGNFNVATSPNRQPGSSFKPFAYAAFLKKGFTPDTVLFDVKTQFSTNPEEPYAPENYDSRFRGPVTAQAALAQSLNLPAVKVLYLAGIQNTVSLAHDMGITTIQDPSRVGLSLVLGGGEVVPLDMAHAYSVFANDGVKNEPSFILSVENEKGGVLERWQKKQKTVLDSNIARTLTQILSDNTLRAPVFGERSHLFFDGYQVAAKTGTTQKYRDAWVLGYTPFLSVAVWVGNNNGDPMERGGAGVAAAGPIFHGFIEQQLTTHPKSDFTPPLPITSTLPILNGNYITETTREIDKDSGKLATPLTPPHKKEVRSFQEIHTILHYINKNSISSPPPEHPDNDPQYTLWEGGIQMWMYENPSFNTIQNKPPIEYDSIHTPQNQPFVRIPPFSVVGEVITIQPTITGPFTVKEVGCFLDGVLVHTDTTTPFECVVRTNQNNQSHIILVQAYDVYDNTGTASVAFQ
ncbi:MAG: penicillin-binding protein [Patescibacteria group bacterium]